MRKIYFSIIVVCLSFLSRNVLAQCNCAWRFKAPITVTNLGGTALTNYQVQMTINTATLVSAGKMLASGADIRFTDNACTNLPYWIESGMNTGSTVIWVKVNSIPASGSATINMFYGNAAATVGSD